MNCFSIENFSSKPKLLAWSSHYENNIEIVELETKQEFANFDGVKLYQMDGIFSTYHIYLKSVTVAPRGIQLDTCERDCKHSISHFPAPWLFQIRQPRGI